MLNFLDFSLLATLFCSPFSKHDISICVSLPEVDLSNNNLGDSGAEAIAGMLKENSTLVSLSLSGNHFTERSAEHLGPALITNAKLQHLNLSYNALGERAGSKVISSVKVSWFL